MNPFELVMQAFNAFYRSRAMYPAVIRVPEFLRGWLTTELERQKAPQRNGHHYVRDTRIEFYDGLGVTAENR